MGRVDRKTTSIGLRSVAVCLIALTFGHWLLLLSNLDHSEKRPNRSNSPRKFSIYG